MQIKPYPPCDVQAYPTTDVKGSKSLLVKTKGHGKLRKTVKLPVLSYGRKLTPFVMKRENLPK
jgi:hypothetical protein